MQHLRAILWMTGAMACLALADLFIKLASHAFSPGELMLAMCAGGAVLLTAVARLKGIRLMSRDALHPRVLIRDGCEIFSAFGMILGLYYNPMSVMAAMMQATPLIVTLGAAVLLGEHVGWRRWAAIAVGLVGVTLILKPGADGFTWNALWALLGAAGLAARDLATRAAPGHVGAVALSTWGFFATVPVAVIAMLAFPSPQVADGADFGFVILSVCVMSAGYLALTSAMRMAPASVVAPYRYTRLVFALALGMAFLGESPDTQMLLGAAIVIGSGLYTLWREGRASRVSATTDPAPEGRR